MYRMYQAMLLGQKSNPYADNSPDVKAALTQDMASFVGAVKVTACERESRRSGKKRIQNKGVRCNKLLSFV